MGFSPKWNCATKENGPQSQVSCQWHQSIGYREVVQSLDRLRAKCELVINASHVDDMLTARLHLMRRFEY
ncbi:uncharacterized protein PHALS_06328 [Plasmopara halstedii]|uniref:Uncharacterized protein n=1 Tax=Plasmopara halstedii TaxID=4781 RepID=A0A0P1B393_PLAHL|nr:uncharacterized protein PHALS_06328 [Plasmopara halstedii]CEG48509.1 hypothetical protein PHALS_06328 [Plasmopara halstedii]|eukprot:XP_024584878.1 hypothetical protein PHALS_06328 [Plasmopara halstedii]